MPGKMPKKGMPPKGMPPKGMPAGMHRMPGGMMMSDAEMKKMMNGGSKAPAKKGKKYG